MLGRKILWDGMDRDGFRFLDRFPSSLIANTNEAEMQITLANGSVFQIIGTDKMDKIVGTNPVGCVFFEYRLQDPKAWDLPRLGNLNRIGNYRDCWAQRLSPLAF